MKILSIAGCNLNSLRSEFRVDFTTGVLKDCGIFAITGPTGAGKTTLLDTITLALYGKTPRSAKDDDIISYGAGEARAEVIFETPEGCFKSEWKVRRSRNRHDGAIQQSSMELSTYPGGQILTQKKREAQEKIRELIKLEYDQFLKSVLLAQGAFKAFLDADERERGEMLEKISDTSLYTTLSKRAFERKREEEKALELLKVKVGNVVVLTDEERSANEDKISLLKEELENIQKDQKDNQRKFNWLETIKDLTGKKIVAEDAVEIAKQRLAEEQPNLMRWEAHQLISGLELQWLQYLAKQQQTILQQQHINNLGERSTTLVEKITQAVNVQAEAEVRLKDAVKDREDKIGILNVAISRKSDVLLEQKELDKLHGRRKIKIKEGLDCKNQVLKNILGLDADKNNLKILETWIAEHKQYAEAGNSFTETSLLVSQLKRNSEDIKLFEATLQTTQDQITKATNEILTAEESKLKAEKEQHSLQQNRDNMLQELSLLKRQLVTEEKQVDRSIEETAILEELQKTELSRQEFLAEHLSKLHEGESCPLCGSTEHPNQARSIDDVHDQIKNIKSLLKQHQTTIKSSKTKQKTIEGILSHLVEVPEFETDQMTTQLPQNFEEVFKELIQVQRAIPNRLNDAAMLFASATDRKKYLTERITELETSKEGTAANLLSIRASLALQLVQLEEIAGLYHLKFDPKKPQLLAEDLKKYSEDFTHKTKEASGINKAIPGVEEGIGMLQRQMDVLRKDLADLDQEILTKTQKIQEFTTEINKSHTGYASPEQARDHLISTEKLSGDKLIEANTILNRLRNEEGKVNGEKENAEAALASLESEIKTLAAKLTAELADLGLEDNLQLIENHLLSGEERIVLGRLYKSLYDQLAMATAQAKNCSEQLELQQAVNLTSEETETIENNIREADAAIQAINREVGELGQVLKEDDDKQARIVLVKKAIEAQEKVLRKWSALSDLIGSADGKKFNQFAQGLTLDRLIVISNHHLQLLNDRYLLKRNVNVYGLGLRIIDQYQADNEREINTLSGGESFLVSLALALGLSEMTSKLTTIDSLFIDEGFGTLDAETLEVALAALRGLQIGGKTIGIISHVERLKEEIFTQVEITKASDGFSTLRVIPEMM